jgi:hypothetical protein
MRDVKAGLIPISPELAFYLGPYGGSEVLSSNSLQ